MPTVVHHYYPLGSSNVGDHLVARALQTQLPKFFGECEFVPMPVNDRYKGTDRPVGLRGDNLNRSNAEADLILIGGSNLLEPRKARGPLWGRIGEWSVFTDLNSIAQVRRPLLLLGMGTGSGFGKPIRSYHNPARDEVRALFAKAFAHAVRDVTTARKLADIGVQTPCVGCPVTFLTDRPIGPCDPAQPLMVSFPPERILKRPGGRAFMSGAIDYLAWLRAQGIPHVVTLHDETDLPYARKLCPPGTDIFWTADLDELIARFEASAGVIGFRLHAALLGVGLGKPMVPVAVDWRCRGMIETFGMESLAIYPRWPGQFAKLRDLTRRLLGNDEALLGVQQKAKEELRGKYEAFLARAAQAYRRRAERVMA